MTTIVYNPANPRFPDVNKYDNIKDTVGFRAAKPVALGFRVYSDLSGEDPTWKADDALAKAMGIVRLGYDYEDNGTADDFLALYPPEPGRIAVLDAEYKTLTMVESELWLTAVAKVYGIERTWWYGHSLPNTWNPAPNSILRRCHNWQSEYALTLISVLWARTPELWQYSDGSLKWASPGPRYFGGIGPCDMNTLYMSVAQLRNIAGLSVGGGDMTEAEVDARINLALTTAKISDAEVQSSRAKAVDDYWLGKPKRTGQSEAYNEAFDTMVARHGIQLP